MNVDVTHPAYVRHTPRGARTMRDALARVTTAASLREVPAGGLERIAKVTVQPQTHSLTHPSKRKRTVVDVTAHDGALYAPLTYTDAYAGPTDLLLPDFLRYLGGDAHGSRLDGLVAAFRGTPVQDLDHTRALHGSHEDGRGLPFDPERQREVAHDGRAEAAAALRAFLDAEILVGGDRVLRRFRPLAQRVEHAAEWIVPNLVRASPLWTPPLVALDRLDDALLVDPSYAVTDEARREAERLLALDPTLAGGDLDVAIGIAEVAGDAARWLHSAVRDREGDPETLRRLVDGFAPFHMRLRTGALPAEDLAEAQRWTRRAVAFVADELNPRHAFLSRVRRAATYLDRVAAPRLQAAAPVAADDIEALEGLRP